MSTNENVQIKRIMIPRISILSDVLAVRVIDILRDHDNLCKKTSMDFIDITIRTIEADIFII